jgi:phosphoserine phosphatase
MENNDQQLKVVVFDLNGTFYSKHSKDEFFKFILSKEPKRFHYYFQMLYYKLLKKLNQIRQTEFKENFFNYLDHLTPDEVASYADEFWKQEFPDHFNKELMRKFDQYKTEGTRIFCATGGLELYVKPLFKLYPIDGFAGTVVEYRNKTYKVVGKACKEEEKIKRIEKYYKDKPFKIIEAYSDSKEPILDKAEHAYLVKDEKIISY